MPHQNLRIALIGNPNCGKTTIFNALTGAHEHVGNYSGVTVERSTAICVLDKDCRAELIDLPGVYSLSATSEEEKIAFRELIRGDIDLILNIVDAGNAKSNLYLSTQLTELGMPLVMAFNMIDEAEEEVLQFDFHNFFVVSHIIYFNIILY